MGAFADSKRPATIHFDFRSTAWLRALSQTHQIDLEARPPGGLRTNDFDLFEELSDLGSKRLEVRAHEELRDEGGSRDRTCTRDVQRLGRQVQTAGFVG